MLPEALQGRGGRPQVLEFAPGEQLLAGPVSDLGLQTGDRFYDLMHEASQSEHGLQSHVLKVNIFAE